MSEAEEKWYLQGLWQKPRILRDWNDDKNVDKKVSWSELFYDLIFVTAISKLGDGLRLSTGEVGALTMADYILYMWTVWQMWWENTQYATRYYLDDLYHKLHSAALMIATIGVAMHVHGGPSGSNGLGFGVSLAIYYFLHSIIFFRLAYHVKRARRTGLHGAFTALLSSLLYLIGGLIDNLTVREALYWAAVCVSSFKLAPFILPCSLSARLLKWFQAVPLNIPHFQERLGCFLMIVLGEVVSGIALDPQRNEGALYSCAFFSFLILFSLKMMYFDVDASDVSTHALRRSRFTGVTFTFLHLPMVVSVALIGSGIDLLMEIQTEPNVDPDSYHKGIWMVAGGLCVFSIALTGIRLTHTPPWYRVMEYTPVKDSVTCLHVDRRFIHYCKLLKKVFVLQICVQILSAVVMVVLPFAALPLYHAPLSTTSFLAINACIGVFVVSVNFLDEVLELRLARYSAEAKDRLRKQVEASEYQQEAKEIVVDIDQFPDTEDTAEQQQQQQQQDDSEQDATEQLYIRNELPTSYGTSVNPSSSSYEFYTTNETDEESRPLFQ